ncbi:MULTISPECIES: DUF4157 domain-containing protein [unclassified Nostoc]|uniref:eCIS core domain-containing protein n=1 Tax=unclassified Nostoc TaxID=2593658 RepID=UPI002AD2A5DE|nr:DUF4157 domain-containing protein [Nostoc sp. DedQUE03]MDZ7975633.1 DUF4157 domain-containing protein [Nostoc sp. DedQUE03]MDZ8047437.1 DUF4157 domain-containing protein [Nostoc sp. DedQUE02]
MYRKQISQKASPSLPSTPISKEIAPSRSYGSGSLSSVVQRVQQDPNSVSGDERQELESAIGTRSTREILAGKQTPWIPEFQGISAQLWGNSGEIGAPIQAKLTIGEAGDKYEQEADRVAKDVVQKINTPQTNALAKKDSAPIQTNTLQRQQTDEEELQLKQLPETVQRREAIAGGEASTDLANSINSARGSGQPLDASLQQSMGQAMGTDFSGVRVHTDAQADQLNQSIQAKAFTTGQDVFFKQGAYNPSSIAGQELLAHELTHVVQQNGGDIVERKVQKKGIKIGLTDSRNNVIQKTDNDAVQLANKYLYNQGYLTYYQNKCQTWNDIQRLQHHQQFSAEEFTNLRNARAARLVHDAQGEVVPFEPLTRTQKQDLATRKQTLSQHHRTHYDILTYIEQQVSNAFGRTGINEFYRGAHIIFNDDALIYDRLFSKAKSLAARNPNQRVRRPNHVMDKSTAAGSAGQATLDYLVSDGNNIPSDAQLTQQELSSGKMFKRRAGTKETSHYGSQQEIAAADPQRPQLGIDFPLAVKGHLLFGVVPNGNGGFNTFVQTEGAGFQNLREHVQEHGKGAIWNKLGSWQTGLIGNSTASEKTNTHLQQ